MALLLAACQGAGSPDDRATGQSSEALIRVADDTRAHGDLGSAVALYRRAAEISPLDPRPLAKLAATLAQLHAYTEAAGTYRQALRLHPNSVEVDLRRGLAVVLLSLDQPDAALLELEKAMAKAPDDPRLYNTLGVAHDLTGRHDLAQEDYRNGLRLAPTNKGLRNNYGLSLALSGDYPGALAALGDLADGTNASPRHRLNLALVYGLAGDDKKAAAIARTALDEAAVSSNLKYYAMLRGMDDRARANAILGSHIVGPAEVAEPPRQEAAAAEAAPRTAVDSAPLPQPATEPAAAPAQQPEAAPGGPATPATSEPAAGAPDTPATGAPVKLTKPGSDATESQPAPEAEPASPPPGQESTAPPEPAPAKPAKHAAAPAKGFVVQLGAFANEANAHKLADQLNKKGYELAVVQHRDKQGRDWFVVRAGGYANAKEAEAAARHMREAEHIPAVPVSLPGSRAATQKAMTQPAAVTAQATRKHVPPAAPPEPTPSSAPPEPTPSAAPPEPSASAAPPEPTPSAASPEPTPSTAPPEPTSTTTEAKPTVAPTGFVIQLGTFASEANAHKLADQLNQKGYELAVVHHRDKEGRDWYIVRAQGYASAEEAEAAARHMREAEKVPAVVVHLRVKNQA